MIARRVGLERARNWRVWQRMSKLQPGEIRRQESIIGSLFEAQYDWADPSEIPAEIANSLPSRARSPTQSDRNRIC